MRELTSIEQNILDRALYLIAKSGSFNVTIRAIAKEANVNVSAINYYFRTKDEMLRLVKEFYIDNTIAAYEPLDNHDYTDEEKIISCANEIIEYTLKYPGILTMLKEANKEKDTDPTSAKIVKLTAEMNTKLDNILSSALNCKEDHFEYKRMIFLSSILHPATNLNITNLMPPIIDNKEHRLKYINYVLETLKDN